MTGIKHFRLTNGSFSTRSSRRTGARMCRRTGISLGDSKCLSSLPAFNRRQFWISDADAGFAMSRWRSIRLSSKLMPLIARLKVSIGQMRNIPIRRCRDVRLTWSIFCRRRRMSWWSAFKYLSIWISPRHISTSAVRPVVKTEGLRSLLQTATDLGISFVDSKGSRRNCVIRSTSRSTRYRKYRRWGVSVGSRWMAGLARGSMDSVGSPGSP